MAEYSNQVGVGIAEVARFDFFEQVNGQTKLISSVVMGVECFKNLHRIIGETIAKYEEAIEKQKETNNKLQ